MGVSLERVVLPLFVAETRDGVFHPSITLGTGFLLAPGLLVTCWHCVEAAVHQGVTVIAVVPTDDHSYAARPLSDIEQDAHGMDLATARIGYEPDIVLPLRKEPLELGSDVFSFGYPLTEGTRTRTGTMAFVLQGRYLQGYVTRDFHRPDRRFGKVPTYELDMLAPAGISGAPLLVVGSAQVAGVVYGAIESYSIVELARRDELTGEDTPEVRRLVTFGAAHYTTSLLRLTGAATNGRPLAEYLASADGLPA